jgi:hypothetical protein
MKKIKQFPLSILMLILGVTISLSSCNYTKNTSTAKSFNKKHYNRGFVKIKNNTADKTSENVAYAENISKKEVISNIEHVAQTKDLSASTEVQSEVSGSYVAEFVINNFASAKEELIAEKAAATNAKDAKKADKALNRIEKLESMIVKHAPRIAEKAEMASAASEHSGGKDGAYRRGLASLILGAVGLFFGFLALNIAAIALGNRAMSLSDPNSQAHRFGRIGKILGWVGVALAIFALLMVILLFALIW